MRNKKLQVWLPLLFSLVLITGMYFGYRMNGSGSKDNFFSTGSRSSLQQAIDVIRRHYVDSVRVDTLQANAIETLMEQLDPHSVYLPPVELKAANEDLAGNFEGIGVEFNVFRDTVNIVYVIPGGPSEKAGLRIGDKIIAVNGQSLTGKDYSNDDIRNRIRGRRGSTAELRIARGNQLQNVPVTRGTIPVSAIDASYMIDPATGYIRVNRFTETSYEEFMRSLEELQQKGMKALVLDLRGNGGGFMNEAVEMADEFLDGDKIVVYTEGMHTKKREYRCRRNGLFETGKLVVLIDELSASASEVLAGALQDWDRATIIGRRSFGKGLVQEQYELRDGGAIRLTVARYYTPLGRSIQRPYEKGKKVYIDELWNRYSSGELLYADSNKVSNGKIYKTKSGKTVYGGGGIMPHIFIPIDTTHYTPAINQLLVDGGFNGFVYEYYLRKRAEIDRYRTVDDFIAGFVRTEEMWAQLVNQVSKDSIDLKPVMGKEKESLKLRLKALLARFRWRTQGFYQVLNSEDAAIRSALEQVRSGK
ncbi:MAG TPA: S41 family peptidase [Chitinophagaceae bacterium]|nr:S41 family peptidase [Chitinophagaceae bacterium]